MKKATIFTVVLMAIALFILAGNVSAQEEKKVDVQFWGYLTDDGLYNVGISGTTNFKYSKVEYIIGNGPVICTDYYQESDDNNLPGIISVVYYGSSFFKNLKLEYSAKVILSVRVYDEDGEWVYSSPLFARTPNKWVFETQSIQPLPSCGMLEIAVTYKINEVHGNEIETGQAVEVIVNDVSYNSVVVNVMSKKFCTIKVPCKVFETDFLGYSTNTVFLTEGMSVTGGFREYPSACWKRPEWMTQPAIH